MPDKSPKNNKKLKESAEVKHEEVKEWKHETPAEKKETHQKESGVKIPFPDKS